MFFLAYMERTVSADAIYDFESGRNIIHSEFLSKIDQYHTAECVETKAGREQEIFASKYTIDSAVLLGNLEKTYYELLEKQQDRPRRFNKSYKEDLEKQLDTLLNRASIVYKLQILDQCKDVSKYCKNTPTHSANLEFFLDSDTSRWVMTIAELYARRKEILPDKDDFYTVIFNKMLSNVSETKLTEALFRLTQRERAFEYSDEHVFGASIAKIQREKLVVADVMAYKKKTKAVNSQKISLEGYPVIFDSLRKYMIREIRNGRQIELSAIAEDFMDLINNNANGLRYSNIAIYERLGKQIPEAKKEFHFLLSRFYDIMYLQNGAVLDADVCANLAKTYFEQFMALDSRLAKQTLNHIIPDGDRYLLRDIKTRHDALSFLDINACYNGFSVN
jgi:hypothetical protein